MSRPTKLLREKMMGFRALSNRFANARRIGSVPSAVTSEKWDPGSSCYFGEENSRGAILDISDVRDRRHRVRLRGHRHRGHRHRGPPP